MSSRPSDSDATLAIEGLALERGTREQTRLRALELADGAWVEIPLIVLRGRHPGPVFYLGAAFHGDEVNGVEIVTRLAGSIDPRELSGTLLVVTAQNPLALQVQHRYFIGHMLKSPLDQSPADPWAAFPGDRRGNMASLIAHTLFSRLVRHAHYLIDIHTPTTGGRYAPFAFLPPPKCGPIVGRAEELARTFGADFILAAESGVYVQDVNPHTVAAHRGTVAFGVELGEGGRIYPEETERGLRGLRNVLRAAGMLAGAVESFGRGLVIGSMTVVRAGRGGLMRRLVELNEDVREGQVVATITDLFGTLVEEITAPHGGPVVRVAIFPIVSAGERVIQLGVPR